MTDTLAWTNARLATCAATPDQTGVVENATLVSSEGKIRYAGPTDEVPREFAAELTHAQNVGGAWITPGLIDCHTHLVFGGDRSEEFERRLEGATYAELQSAGGGIFGSVKATRENDNAALFAAAASRLRTLASTGVTTVEIKSGYGLDTATELRMLEVNRRLQADERLPDVVSTCLAAHALPTEYAERRDQYIRTIIDELLPEVAARGLASAVDAFGEHIAFTPDEIERVFITANALGLQIKLHADQLSNQHGAALAARFGALSADHLEYTDVDGVEAMASAGTVAVLLPVAFYTLRESRVPPIGGFREAGVPMAVATDANPGSAPTLSLPLAMNMACTLFGLTVEEALLGVTRNAAQALGLQDRGTLEPGQRCDLCIWDVERLAQIVCWMGHSYLKSVVRNGVITA